MQDLQKNQDYLKLKGIDESDRTDGLRAYLTRTHEGLTY